MASPPPGLSISIQHVSLQRIHILWNPQHACARRVVNRSAAGADLILSLPMCLHTGNAI